MNKNSDTVGVYCVKSGIVITSTVYSMDVHEKHYHGGFGKLAMSIYLRLFTEGF